VVVVNGTGGRGSSAADVAAARLATPGWEWVHLDRAHGTWVDDPWPLLCSASVVVSHAGQNLIAEIAAARRPAADSRSRWPATPERQPRWPAAPSC
jgi:hypothetical protein